MDKQNARQTNKRGRIIDRKTVEEKTHKQSKYRRINQKADKQWKIKFQRQTGKEVERHEKDWQRKKEKEVQGQIDKKVEWQRIKKKSERKRRKYKDRWTNQYKGRQIIK